MDIGWVLVVGIRGYGSVFEVGVNFFAIVAVDELTSFNDCSALTGRERGRGEDGKWWVWVGLCDYLIRAVPSTGYDRPPRTDSTKNNGRHSSCSQKSVWVKEKNVTRDKGEPLGHHPSQELAKIPTTG
jgi:hypothetical protein